MRSKELADLAGVSVRTLRHYHAIGLLPEPARHANGYRDYGAEDLARVLRIKRLASLGFPLDQIGSMLDELDVAADGPCTATARLDELDAELAAEIERLEAQRALIAQIKHDHVAPDLPTRGGYLMNLMHDLKREAGYDVSAFEETYDRTALLLASHLYDDDEFAEMKEALVAIGERGLSDAMYAVGQRIDDLAPDASESERAALAEETVDVLLQMLDCFKPENWLRDYNAGEKIVLSYTRSAFNPAQNDVVERVEAAIGRHMYDLLDDSSKKALDPDATS